MSSFTTVRTQIKEKDTLCDILKEMGYETEETENGRLKLKGHGIYFDKRSNNCFEVGANWYHITDISEREFMRDLNQKYARQIVMREVKRKGYRLSGEKKLKDGTIRMVVLK